MVKNHLKRLTIPTTWKGVLRKEDKFIVRPCAGPHAREQSFPLNLIIKKLGLAKTSKEVRHILNTKKVLVDGRRIRDDHFPVGVFDIVSFPDIKKHVRVLLDKRGNLTIVEVSKNTTQKISRVINRRIIAKGKLQINLLDGRNILTDDKTIKRGDSLVLELPSQKIVKHLPLKEGSQVILVGGKHRGDSGIIKNVSATKITYENKDKQIIETLRPFAYVITEL
ncbi:30S ribosomal protein S4e [Candidatus Woesearchaeota archaeon]|nr:30S ribosomal protein S4e [Candidatus Woesearchaeota archaeon]